MMNNYAETSLQTFFAVLDSKNKQKQTENN